MRFLVFLLLSSVFLGLSACGGSGGGGADPGEGNEGVAGVEGEAHDDARNYTLSLVENGQVSIDLAQISLPEGSTIQITESPAHGTVVLSGTQASFTPEQGYTGADEFLYTLTQANETVDTYRVTLQISPAQQVAAQFSIDGVAKWKGNAKAAYSIVHDDFCSGPFNSSGMVNYWRELETRGLVAGFGVVIRLCDYDPENYYPEMHRMAEAGMEIINHSYTHPVDDDGLGLLGADVDWNVELWDAHAVLESKGFHDVSYYVFPQDSSNDPLLEQVKAMNYLGARGGERQQVSSSELDTDDSLAPFKANFDCFNIHQAGEVSCSRSPSDDARVILDSYLDHAIESNGGWALRELHGIGEGDSWGWVKIQEYLGHLDYVKLKVDAGDVWMDTPTNVTKYWASRAYCGEPETQNPGMLEFTNYQDISSCSTYSTPLDVIITADNANSIAATQDDKSIPVRSLGGNKFILEIDPVGGEVSVFQPSS